MRNDIQAVLKDVLQNVEEAFGLDESNKLICIDAEKQKVIYESLGKAFLEVAWKKYQALDLQENDAELEQMAGDIAFEELGGHASKFDTDREQSEPSGENPTGEENLPEGTELGKFDMNSLFEFGDNLDDISGFKGGEDGFGGMADLAGDQGSQEMPGEGEGMTPLEPDMGGQGMGQGGEFGGDDLGGDFTFDLDLASIPGDEDGSQNPFDGQQDGGFPNGAQGDDFGQQGEDFPQQDDGVTEETMDIVPSRVKTSNARPMGNK